MTVPDQFYLDQAAECARSAAGATLSNQREKYLRAQAAWEALANRNQYVRAARERREAVKDAGSISEMD